MPFRLLVTLIFAGLFSAKSFSAVDAPITFRHGLIWVDVSVQGQDLRFILDSGAGVSVVDARTAQKLGLRFGNSESVQGVQGRCVAKQASGFHAAIMGVPLPDRVLALDLSRISAAEGRKIDGLVGVDFFRAHALEINFKAQKLKIYGHGEFAGASNPIPLSRVNDTFAVQVAVEGCQPQLMRLDTGCASSVEWVRSARQTHEFPGKSVAAASVSDRGACLIDGTVKIGTAEMQNVSIALHEHPIFSGESGLIGSGLLSRFNLTIDGANSRMFLSKPE